MKINQLLSSTGTSTGSVVCNDNHTVTITIMNVIDIDEFNESDWRIDDKEECEPTFFEQTVTYTNLPVGNCSSKSEERDNDILYVFKIRVLPTGNDPIQAVDHMFDASCVYVNNDTVTASFIPLTQRGDNATGKISSDGAVLRALVLHQCGSIQTQCHIWVESFVGSRDAPKAFLRPGSP